MPTINAASLSELSISLPLIAGSNGGKEFGSELPGIYNGYVTGFRVEECKKNTCVLSLCRATKDLEVMIQRLGTDVKSDEFEIYIKDASNALEWNMHPISIVAFSYFPYNIKTDVGESDEGAWKSEDDVTGMGAIVAVFSTLAFSPDSPSILVI